MRLDGTSGPTTAVRIDGSRAVEIPGVTDVGALLAQADWREIAESADGPTHPMSDIPAQAWAPVVPSPSKIICVGLNYAHHIAEMGRDLPEFPTLFAKFPEALIGPYDDIAVPTGAAQALDWEGELAVVIGSSCRAADLEASEAAIAGYAVINDVTMRDYQYRTTQWLQGKTLEGSSPFGPYLTTADELPAGAELRTTVDDEVVQTASVDDLVFTPRELVSYISRLLTLHPGDVIATGTPGGVGHARKPPRYLTDGAQLGTSIEGLGELSNTVRIGGARW